MIVMFPDEGMADKFNIILEFGMSVYAACTRITHKQETPVVTIRTTIDVHLDDHAL